MEGKHRTTRTPSTASSYTTNTTPTNRSASTRNGFNFQQGRPNCGLSDLEWDEQVEKLIEKKLSRSSSNFTHSSASTSTSRSSMSRRHGVTRQPKGRSLTGSSRTLNTSHRNRTVSRSRSTKTDFSPDYLSKVLDKSTPNENRKESFRRLRLLDEWELELEENEEEENESQNNSTVTRARSNARSVSRTEKRIGTRSVSGSSKGSGVQKSKQSQKRLNSNETSLGKNTTSEESDKIRNKQLLNYRKSQLRRRIFQLDETTPSFYRQRM